MTRDLADGLPFFPVPFLSGSTRSDGSVVAMPEECVECPARECESAVSDGKIGLCRYGFNFLRLSDELLAFGFLVAGQSAQNKRHRQRLRQYGRTALQAEQVAQLQRSQRALMEADRRVEDRNLLDREEVLLRDPEQLQDLVHRLEPHIQSAAGQLHDYIDLAAQILKQLNVYMGANYPNIEIPDDLDQAPDELQSIYWLARLMEEKVAAFGYYLNPESIREEEDSFRLHGLVTKYKKMYQRACQQKRVRVEVGQDYSAVTGNRDALSVIVHALFDNAVKYAPPDSTIRILFERVATAPGLVEFTIVSLGPRLTDEERTRIFLPFVRGEAAARRDVEGMGFGLAFAHRIAAEYGQEIRVEQEPGPSSVQGLYETRFSFRFPLT